MMRIFLAIIFFLLFTSTTLAQEQAIHRVFTFGNVADIPADSPFFGQLEQLLDIEESYTVIITGDLVDTDISKKIPESDKLKLERLLGICQSSEKSRVLIIPGDRDWNDSSVDGLKCVKKLEDTIEEMELDRVEWVISKGCPGPKSLDLSPELVLVAIDTQWWNHPYDKPRPADGDCKIITETDFLSELEEAIVEAEGKNVIVAGHFPLLSVGPYGGKQKWTRHVFPPIVGSMIAAFHQNVGGNKDINNERFDDIRGELLDIIDDQGSIIYVSGHEHNLEILSQHNSFLVNSGSPVSPSYAGRDSRKVIYAESVPGIIELFYYADGRVDYNVLKTVQDSGFVASKKEPLMVSSCSEHGLRYKVNTHFVPCAERREDNTGVTSAVQMTKQGGAYKAGSMTRFFLGNHYRSTWTEDVCVPYLNLDTTNHGLTIYQKGGGRQTTSLKIRGDDGREYVFRSVDKQPTRVLSDDLKETVLAKILQDATSMQNPYGAMAISSMLDHTKILHASPKLYILPDDKSLGIFQKEYAGLLGMLEEKPKNPDKVENPFGDADEILQSFKLLREQYNDHDHRIAQDEYAICRLFDIMVGDWGRHQDNWKWAGYKQEDGMLYRPIPRDRDHVFSLWDGFLPYIADRKWGKESGEHFGYTIHDIRSLTWQTRHSDRFWLSEANREDWIAASEYIHTHITEDVIDEAVRQMPAEVLEISGLEIAAKLKQRRLDLQRYAEEYYELLSKEVDVVGSNKKEIFSSIRNDDGSVLVSVYDYEKGGVKGELLYERLFLPSETKEIRLYGLEGNDVFELSGESRQSIRIRVIGGPGKDDVNDSSLVKRGAKKTLIYENNDKSELNLGEEAKQVFGANPTLYNYNRTRFEYNRYMPLLGLGYNSTGGFSVTAGVKFTNQKFGKKDFSSIHAIKAKFSTEEVRIFQYNGRFRQVIREWDLSVEASVADKSDFIRFYGIGNGVPIITQEVPLRFYRTRFTNYTATVGLVQEFWKRSSVSLSAHYENNTTIQDIESVVADLPENFPGLNDANLLEAVLAMDLDFRDRTRFPNKGMRLFVQYQNGVNTVDKNNYFIARGSLESHSTFRVLSPWTLSLRASGSTSTGEQVIPFYHMVYLGQNTGLRGYQSNRFTGKRTADFSTELRIQLIESFTTFIPIKFGVKGFLDVGRVYSDFDVTKQFFTGYGAGIYIIPYTQRFALNLSYGISEEESGLILFSIGSSFK